MGFELTTVAVLASILACVFSGGTMGFELTGAKAPGPRPRAWEVP